MLNFSSARIKKKTFNKLGKYDQKFWTLLTDVSEARLCVGVEERESNTPICWLT